MIVTQSDSFDVPAAQATILQLRETNSYQRTLLFRNLTASDLSCQIEHSADGGTTWVVIDTAFTISAIGGGSEVAIKNISSTYAGSILRVRASGGGDDRDLQIHFTRMYLDTAHVWSSPVL